MSDQFWQTLLIALAPTITALAGLIVSVNSARRNREKIEDNTRTTEAVLVKTAEIHTLTNGNLSKVTSALDVATEKIAGLQKLIESMHAAKAVADTLATKAVDDQKMLVKP